MIAPEDLLNASEVAQLLGLSHREAVATYRRRYPEFPAPLIEKGTCVLWARNAVNDWADWRRRSFRGPLVWCTRTAEGHWIFDASGLPIDPVRREFVDFIDGERELRLAIGTAFAPDAINPEFRLGEPTIDCVYCGEAIKPTGGSHGVGQNLPTSGRCTACDVRYRQAGPIGWNLA